MKPTMPHPYRGLPPLAGVTTFEAAMQPGLSVGDSVSRLKRFHYAFWRLHGILIARLTAGASGTATGRVAVVAKASCAAVLGSGVMELQ